MRGLSAFSLNHLLSSLQLLIGFCPNSTEMTLSRTIPKVFKQFRLDKIVGHNVKYRILSKNDISVLYIIMSETIIWRAFEIGIT